MGRAEDKINADTARITVVIPSYNGKRLLLECLRSLQAQTYRDFDVIVVDDASSDDTAEATRQQFPDTRVIRRGRNGGFCAAINEGIRAAQGEWLFLLNNDMTLDPECLARLAKAAEAFGANVALLAPLVLWRDDPTVIYSAGDRQLTNGRPEAIGFRATLDTFIFPETIFGVTAGAGLYRRDVFERVGLFDESFNCYFSDSDISFRARLAGFTAQLVPDARASHVGSAGLAGKTWRRSAQCFRNHVWLVMKNMPARLVARHAVAILRERLHQVRRLVSDARTEFGLLGALALLVRTGLQIPLGFPRALAARRRIQRGRVISIEEIDCLLARPDKAGEL